MVVGLAGVAHAQVTESSKSVSLKVAGDTFRFRPGAIEFRDLGTRRASYLLVIRIDDKRIPADYFEPLHNPVWDTEVEKYRRRLEDIMTKDDGYLTVVGQVRERIPRDRHMGSPEWWIDGRVLRGSIVGWGN